MIDVRNAVRIAVAAALPVLAVGAVPAEAQAETGLQGYFASQGIPGHFWAGSEASTIVSVASPKTYQVCNLSHVTERTIRPDLRVEVDGSLVSELAQGRCIDVEGTEITVASDTDQGPAHGSYHLVQ
jgi:hypothetical protein